MQDEFKVFLEADMEDDDLEEGLPTQVAQSKRKEELVMEVVPAMIE